MYTISNTRRQPYSNTDQSRTVRPCTRTHTHMCAYARHTCPPVTHSRRDVRVRCWHNAHNDCLCIPEGNGSSGARLAHARMQRWEMHVDSGKYLFADGLRRAQTTIHASAKLFITIVDSTFTVYTRIADVAFAYRQQSTCTHLCPPTTPRMHTHVRLSITHVRARDEQYPAHL
jgi:hypothetical protein